VWASNQAIVLPQASRADIELGVDYAELIHRLPDQLIPMGQHQGTAGPLVNQLGKYEGFAGAGRQTHQWAAYTLHISVIDGIDSLMLVIARLYLALSGTGRRNTKPSA